jgi:hypothetical protein
MSEISSDDMLLCDDDERQSERYRLRRRAFSDPLPNSLSLQEVPMACTATTKRVRVTPTVNFYDMASQRLHEYPMQSTYDLYSMFDMMEPLVLCSVVEQHTSVRGCFTERMHIRDPKTGQTRLHQVSCIGCDKSLSVCLVRSDDTEAAHASGICLKGEQYVRIAVIPDCRITRLWPIIWMQAEQEPFFIEHVIFEPPPPPPPMLARDLKPRLGYMQRKKLFIIAKACHRGLLGGLPPELLHKIAVQLSIMT